MARRGLELTGAADVTRQRFEWLYLNNPQGPAHLNLLHSGEDSSLVGMLGVGRRDLHIGGDEAVHAGLLVDFVVSPEHRSAYPALVLQRQGRELALQSLDMLYGLPAPQAVAICKRLETQVWLDFPRYARVLRFRGYVRRLLPAFMAFPLGFFADGLVRLGVRAACSATPHTGNGSRNSTRASTSCGPVSIAPACASESATAASCNGASKTGRAPSATSSSSAAGMTGRCARTSSAPRSARSSRSPTA